MWRLSDHIYHPIRLLHAKNVHGTNTLHLIVRGELQDTILVRLMGHIDIVPCRLTGSSALVSFTRATILHSIGTSIVPTLLGPYWFLGLLLPIHSCGSGPHPTFVTSEIGVFI